VEISLNPLVTSQVVAQDTNKGLSLKIAVEPSVSGAPGYCAKETRGRKKPKNTAAKNRKENFKSNGRIYESAKAATKLD
jgi:hypothetical protein